MVVLGIAGMLWLSGCRADDPTRELDATLVGIPSRIQPDWDLHTPEGKAFGIDALLGRWTLVTVGYTSCPDVCPGTLLGVADALDRWEAEGREVQAVFVAVDPARDAPHLEAYTHHFHDGIVGLTGSEPALRDAVDALGGSFTVTETDEGVVVDHATSAFLVDPQGRVEVVHTRPADGPDLAREVAAYIDAWTPSASFQGWVRRPAPGAGAAAGYGTLVDHSGRPRTVASVGSPHARSVHTHETVQRQGHATMRPTTLALPARGRTELRPGGAHLMFSGLEAERDTVLLSFHLSDGSAFWTRAPLQNR